MTRKIFGSEKDKVTGDWRRLQIEKVSDYYWFLSDESGNRWLEHLSCMGEETNEPRVWW